MSVTILTHHTRTRYEYIIQPPYSSLVLSACKMRKLNDLFISFFHVVIVYGYTGNRQQTAQQAVVVWLERSWFFRHALILSSCCVSCNLQQQCYYFYCCCTALSEQLALNICGKCNMYNTKLFVLRIQHHKQPAAGGIFYSVCACTTSSSISRLPTISNYVSSWKSKSAMAAVPGTAVQYTPYIYSGTRSMDRIYLI